MSPAMRALALPLQAAPLLLVAIFSLLLLFGVKAGVPGIPVLLIVGSWFLKYGFVLLDHAAQGRPGAPVLTAEHANPVGEMRPLAYGLLIAAGYLATGALADAVGGTPGRTVATTLRLAGLAALPAVLATHTVTGSLANALNPLVVVQVTRRLGPGYLLIALVAAACGWLGRFIVLDGSGLWLLLRIALLMLLWLELFAVLGGVVHGRRHALGFEPEHSPERSEQRAEAERDRERQRFVDQLFAECRAGSPRNALETVRRRALEAAEPVAEYEWIYRRVAEWPDARLANAVARELLTRLLAARRNGHALRIAKDRLQADPAFRPAGGEQALRLAELAIAGGERPLARRLLEDFESRFPGDPGLARARRLAAELARR